MKNVFLDKYIGGDIDDAICLASLLKEPLCDLIGADSREVRYGWRQKEKAIWAEHAFPRRPTAMWKSQGLLTVKNFIVS